jgi:hypothetical protein
MNKELPSDILSRKLQRLATYYDNHDGIKNVFELNTVKQIINRNESYFGDSVLRTRTGTLIDVDRFPPLFINWLANTKKTNLPQLQIKTEAN